MSPINIRWVLAHEPIDIFIRAAEKFADIVESRAPGQIKIEILTLPEYAAKYNNGKSVTKHDLCELLDNSQFEMSQMYTYVLRKYNTDLDALDLPFLFRDHEHAARVFESDIGEELLAGYGRKSNIRGMAFTYSGGFINMPFKGQVVSLSDLAGANVRVSCSPVAIETWAVMGANPVPMDVEDVADGIRDGRIDGGESSWPRVYGCGQNEVANCVIEPNHRLLLTNIIINKNFLASLTPELQDIMKQAAIEAGRFERAVAVAEVEPTKVRCEADGIRVVKLSKEDEQSFRKISEKVYEQFAESFSVGLVDRIKNA